MANGSKPKVNEHYIPRMYLDRFSVTGTNKPAVWQYDLLRGWQSPYPVPTESVCFERNLYEFQNDEGVFLNRNRIENNLSHAESVLADYFRKIDSKALIDDNLKTQCFLTSEEKGALSLFLGMHTIRNPETLSEAEKLVPQYFGSELKGNVCRNLAKYLCLEPFINLDKLTDETSLLSKASGLFTDMAYIVFRTSAPIFFTSDQFLQIYRETEPVMVDGIIRPGSVAFPLSPTLLVYMCQKEKMKAGMRNKLVDVPPQMVLSVQERTAVSAKRWIYSSTPFTENQIKMFEEIRKKRV